MYVSIYLSMCVAWIESTCQKESASIQSVSFSRVYKSNGVYKYLKCSVYVFIYLSMCVAWIESTRQIESTGV